MTPAVGEINFSIEISCFYFNEACVFGNYRDQKSGSKLLCAIFLNDINSLGGVLAPCEVGREFVLNTECCRLWQISTEGLVKRA